MAKNQGAQDEFVDLYEVLEVPENADTETIRQRVNVLYLEAQQNLDHRNVKRRLQFQQMYEIYLPQARHLLLDIKRRGEYDRYLQAYRTGSKVQTTSDEAASNTIGGDMAGTPEKISSHDIPELIEEEVDPTQLAVEREAMWAKWKTGLEIVTEEPPLDPLPGTAAPSPPAAAAAPSAQTSSTSPGAPAPAPRPGGAPRQRPQPVVPRFQPPGPGGARPVAQPVVPRPAPPTPGRPMSEAPAAPEHSVSELDRQREQQRYQLIKNAVQNAGLMWGIGGGAIAFLVGCALLFTLDNALKPAPFGLSRTVFDLIGFIIVLIASGFTAYMARKKGKRKAVGELSLLPLDELMRRAR